MQNDVFAQCTDQLRHAIIDAKLLAQRRGDESVWPEHLFLSIARDGCANAVFSGLGLSLAAIQDAFLSEFRDHEFKTTDPELDEKSMQVMQSMREFADSLGHSFRGDEHLIWGLLDVSSPVCWYLQLRGLSSDAIRDQVLELIGPSSR